MLQWRIDVHAHYFPNDYLDLVEALAPGEVATHSGRQSATATRADDLHARLAAMDESGIDMQILSIATSGPYLSDAGHAATAARAVNDAYAEATTAHPTRFAAFAALPFPHVPEALTELARALDELDMKGVGVMTMMGGKTLADPSFDPVYAELDRRGSVLCVHPAGRSCESPLLDETSLTWPLGAPFEDTAAALQLLQSGFARRFPNVRVIVPHLGGTLPFLVQRLDHMASRFMNGNGTPSIELRKFWYDSVNGHPAALRCACDTFGVDRILFGTDYPFWRDEAHRLAAEYITQAQLPPDHEDAIYSGNATALFRGRLPFGLPVSS